MLQARVPLACSYCFTMLPPPSGTDLVLASARQPKSAALLNIRIAGGTVTHLGRPGRCPRRRLRLACPVSAAGRFRPFGALGVTASVQPAPALDDRDAAEITRNSRTNRAFPLRSLLDAGAVLVLGSDARCRDARGGQVYAPRPAM